MIPTVFLSGNSNLALSAIKEAALKQGCFIVRNSPFSKHLHHLKVQEQLKTFYGKTLQEKLALGNIQGKGATRGYFEMGSESGSELVELKESFSFGHNAIPDSFKSTLADKNLWPKEFQVKDFQALHDSFTETAEALVDLLQKAIGAKVKDTIDETSRYQSFVRSFKYHGIQKNSNQTGNSLHTDWNLLTLVWTDQPGFQYLQDDGKFYDLYDETDTSALICNFGDFLSSLTNGQIRSPWHQVKQQYAVRHSLVYFYYPSAQYPAQKNIIYQQRRPLGLFVDQSKPGNQLWNVPSTVQTMEQMYSEKWKQVSRSY